MKSSILLVAASSGVVSCFGKGLAEWMAGATTGGVVGRAAVAIVSFDGVGCRDVPPLKDAVVPRSTTLTSKTSMNAQSLEGCESFCQ